MNQTQTTFNAPRSHPPARWCVSSFRTGPLGFALAFSGSLLTSIGCGGDSGSDQTDGAPNRQRPPPSIDMDRDLIKTTLAVDVSSMNAAATIEFVGAAEGGLSLEIGDLEIISVADSIGPLQFEDTGDAVNIGIPTDVDQVTIEYRYSEHRSFDGAIPGGLTFSWPYFCGNLFPCKSGPEDGLRFALSLEGVPSDQTMVFASEIPSDAPSYMLAWALGDYTHVVLGTTTAGTEVGTYASTGLQAQMASGTATLVDAFDWFEENLGAYSFGNKVASVSAAWGPGAFGGMEHHPLWHVATSSLSDQETHVHEAAHGWFGNGVRIECWEDFVLSEGTVSYLAARALEEVAGTEASDPVWQGYRNQLNAGIAWPDGCGDVDILEDGLFSAAPYVKGALFFRSLETRLGRPVFDAALASFYVANVGKAARFADLLAHFFTETGYDANACALSWLRSSAIPATEVCSL